MELLRPCLVSFLSFLLVLPTSAKERPTLSPGKSTRSVTYAPTAMVCACHPLAVEVGLEILRKGGNAVDAAIGVNAALGFLEPMSCGIGGDLFAIVYNAKEKKLYGLNASGRAPALANPEYFASRGLTSIPEKGPLSWSVPGCVNGWQVLRDKLGSKSLAEILEPSIAYAEKGAPVPEVIASYWKASEAKLNSDPGSRAVFMPQGKALATGKVFRNPALANTYRKIAKDGAKAFYQSDIAKSLDRYSKEVGGLIRLEDLLNDKPTWVDPISTTYRGVEVLELPPNGQGLAALQMLNTLENYDIARMGFSSPEYWHLFLEAKKLAFADRARLYADPDFTKVPFRELASKSYAKSRLDLIKPDSVLENIPSGDPKLGKSDTTYLCVVDKDRNCVSLIQSNYNGFGSGNTPPELGFAIQNRGTLFALDKNHPNVLAPGKRPFHTIIPAMALKDKQPWLVFGVMGGDMQPQGHVQVLVNLIDFEMNLQAAGDAPRMEHRGSATPKGDPADGSGTILVENGMPQSVLQGLQKLGHKIRTVQSNSGGYQAILIDPKTGMLQGATESRKDGIAGGY